MTTGPFVGSQLFRRNDVGSFGGSTNDEAPERSIACFNSSFVLGQSPVPVTWPFTPLSDIGVAGLPELLSDGLDDEDVDAGVETAGVLAEVEDCELER